MGKLSNPNFNARDLLAIAQSLDAGLKINEHLEQTRLQTPLIKKLTDLIFATIVDDPPLATREGEIIRAEYSPELKEIIDLSTNSHQQLMQMEAKEKQETGIGSLKIKYNNVFGYFIEVTHTHTAKVPAHYKRKQTLATAERYVTDELISLESKILSAKQRRAEMEYEIFSELKSTVEKESSTLLTMAQIWCELDVITSFAWLALEKNYSRPTFSDTHISLKASRHPVIEQELKTPFIPNDIEIKKHHCLLLLKKAQSLPLRKKKRYH
jgi:DNA mismatch repair protein MutS